MLSLVASPMGARIGVTTARVGNSQVVISVAPKMWRHGPPRSFSLSGQVPQGLCSVGLHELDRLALHESSANTAAIEALLGASRREVDGGLTWDSSMLAPEIARRPYTSEEPPQASMTSVLDLLRLFGHVDLLDPDLADLQGRPRQSQIHRPLLYRRLLLEVTRNVSATRPSYRLVTEARATVRGRVSAGSLAAIHAGVASRIVCSYSELSLSTELLGVITAALEWIADGKGVRSLLPAEYSDLRLRHDAVMLRRALGEVRALAPAMALRVGRGLRLGRLDQSWTDALRLAVSVLGEREPLPNQSGDPDVDAVELSAPTHQVWERIVTAALERSGFEEVMPQGRQPVGITADPWQQHLVRVPLTRPDNITIRFEDIFIVDAKYKTPPLGEPNRGDQYQMFAYSHLVAASPRVVRAAVLVYPGETPRAVWTRGRDASERPVELYSVTVPFPSRFDVTDPVTWGAFLERAGNRIRDELGLVHREVARLLA